MKNLFLKLAITFVFFIFAFQLKSQAQVDGLIADKATKEAIPIAVVQLTSPADSTNILQFVTADLHGYFELDTIPDGEYLLVTNHISYLPDTQSVTIENNVNKTLKIFLSQDLKNLSEVTVKGQKEQWFSEKTDYTITNKDRKSKLNPLQLLELIPELEVDNLDQTVQTIDRKKVKLLLNGRNADTQDLLALNNKEIVRLEYYDLPQARYAKQGFEVVVDIITREPVNGWRTNINLNNAFTTGHGTDQAAFKLSLGHFQMDMLYKLTYKKYKKILIDELTEYTINQQHFSKKKEGINSPLRYLLQSPKIGFGLSKKDDYDIYCKVLTTQKNSQQTQRQQVTYQSNGLLEERKYVHKDSADNFKLLADLYFFKKINGRNDLTVDVVYSFFNNDIGKLELETNSQLDSTYYQSYQTQTHKKTVIAEVIYTQYFKDWRINFGGKSAFSVFDQKETANNLHQNLGSHFGYIEAIGKINEFGYSASLGAVRNNFSEDQFSNKFNHFDFYPKLSLRYTFSKKSNVKLAYSYRNINPSIYQLNPTRRKVDEHIWREGNPKLRPYSVHQSNFTFFVKPEKIYFYAVLRWRNIKNGIKYDYQFEDDIITSKSIAYDDQSSVKASFSLGGNLFKDDWFDFMIYSQLGHYKNQLNQEKWMYNSFYYAMRTTAKYKDFSLRVSYNAPYHAVFGKNAYEQSGSMYTSLFWKKPNYQISLSYSYILKSGWHSNMQSLENSIVQSTTDTNYYDFGNLISLSLSHQFTKGKISKSRKQKIKNDDNDDGEKSSSGP